MTGLLCSALVQVELAKVVGIVMLATGHQTEKQFNESLGINEEELIASHQQTARRLPRQSA